MNVTSISPARIKSGSQLKYKTNQIGGGVSFKGVDKFYTSYASEVFGRLSKYSNVNHKAFEKIAFLADDIAKKGNSKPKMLVETMVKFVETVETSLEAGLSLTKACIQNSGILVKSGAENSTQKSKVFDTRWKYLAVQSVKASKKDAFKSVTPLDGMNPTTKKIVFTPYDERDMFEFLRKNWANGNAAYRNIKKGTGFTGWLKYMREEFFPQYWSMDDRLGRKH